MIVWGFFYNHSVCESAAALQDLFATEEGATRAMNTHKEFAREDHKKKVKWYKQENIPQIAQYDFDYYKQWFVQELNVKE